MHKCFAHTALVKTLLKFLTRAAGKKLLKLKNMVPELRVRRFRSARKNLPSHECKSYTEARTVVYSRQPELFNI